VRNFEQYQATLRENGVILNPQERRVRILDQVQSLLRENNLRLKENEDLLNTLVYLTEHPTPLLGAFDPSFLSLPQEVLITVMRGHQKYLAVEQPDGTLAPRFIAVTETDADRTGAIRHGHERVLRARFNDAQFFWNTDVRLRLKDRLELLRNVTFQSQLGSYYDKAERLAAILARLADPLPAELAKQMHLFQEAAWLTKCDLTTELVKEFTELQGVVGGLCAVRERLPKEIADAIYDHYRPQSMEDRSPRTLGGALVSLADRIDTLVGCFGVGLVPSGSKDPFALRRASQGIIRILVDHELHLPLQDLVEAGASIYHKAQEQGKVAAWREQTPALLSFLDDRLRYYLRDVRGFSYDEVNAVLASNISPAGRENYNVPDILKRLEALARIRPTENFEPLAASFKRMKNILNQARESYGFKGDQLRPELLEPGPEQELYRKYREVSETASQEKSKGDFLAALEAIASLRPDVDRFFDKVLVMDKNPEVRNNRLALLETLSNEFSTIADFSEIVPKETTRAN
jgi:glycyl-tRNA synthetase beta chain